METKKYIVMVDDNFHHMDESERYKHGEYDTVEEAISECKRIVEDSINYKEGDKMDELLSNYAMFGDDPFIVEYRDFSAREYARAYVEKLRQEKS